MNWYIYQSLKYISKFAQQKTNLVIPWNNHSCFKFNHWTTYLILLQSDHVVHDTNLLKLPALNLMLNMLVTHMKVFGQLALCVLLDMLKVNVDHVVSALNFKLKTFCINTCTNYQSYLTQNLKNLNHKFSLHLLSFMITADNQTTRTNQISAKESTNVSWK